MIYTSNFSKMRSLPKDVLTIAICRKVPEWYEGPQYKVLAPSYDIFVEYKNNHNIAYYINDFTNNVLNKLDIEQVIYDLVSLSKLDPNKHYNHIALLCYESTNEFCHRYLVGQWLINHGYKCEEYVFN